MDCPTRNRWRGATAVAGDEQLLSPTADVSIGAMLMDNPDVTMTMPYEAAPSPTLLVAFN